MTPLGVDFSTFSINPAGIGWIRNGYFVVTPGYKSENISSTLLDGDSSPLDVNRGNFAIPNVGVVFANETRSVYWPTFNVGIGINRMADFNETISFRGRNSGSLLDAFVEDANDGIFNDFRNNLAFETGAILEDDQGFFSDFFSNPEGAISRDGQVVRDGGISEFVVTMGGNYRDMVMWGLTLGVPFMNYSETRSYNEIDDEAVIDFFDNLSFDETLETEGSGVNFKFGVLIRPTQILRISLAAHSPTFWSIDESYETTFSYAYTDEDTNEALGGTALSPRSEFSYNLQTPWRLIGGLGAVVGRSGFVAVDVDYLNYAGNQFSYDDFTEEATAVNEEIDNLLESALSFRVGGEYNLNGFQIRAGAGVRNYPVAGTNQSDLLLSGGLGYRKDRFFIDLAYQYGSRDRIFQPYPTFAATPQQVEVNMVRHNFLLGGGVSF